MIGYPPFGSLIRQGPVPFFIRLTKPDTYEAAVVKYMRGEGWYHHYHHHHHRHHHYIYNHLSLLLVIELLLKVIWMHISKTLMDGLLTSYVKGLAKSINSIMLMLILIRSH